MLQWQQEHSTPQDSWLHPEPSAAHSLPGTSGTSGTSGTRGIRVCLLPPQAAFPGGSMD